MRRSAVIITAAAALVASGLLSFPASAAHPRSAELVATGTVVSATGHAMPGAVVDLYAWPSDAVLKAMKPGQTVPVTLLATTTTNSAGRYTVAVPAARLKAAAVESGYANLEIYSPAGGLQFFSYQAGSLPARPPAPVTVSLRGKATVNCGNDPWGHPYSFWAWQLVAHKKPAWAVVGQGYIIRQRQTRGDYVHFQYTKGASHTQASALGIGLSGYGIDAGYSSAGSTTSTASRSAGFPDAHGNAWFRTLFRDAEYRGLCYEVPADLKVPHLKQHPPKACPVKWLPPGYPNIPQNYHYIHKCYWLVHSTGWFGGTNIVVPRKAPATPARWCAPYLKGSDFGGDFGKAVQWSSGFDLGAALNIKGVNLRASFNGSAQTGYDSNAAMDFHFGHAGYLCGTNGSNATAAILVQRASKP